MEGKFFNPFLYLTDLITNPRHVYSNPNIYKLKYLYPRRIDDKIEVRTPVIFPGSYRSAKVRKTNDLFNFSSFGKLMENPCIVIVNDPRRETMSILKRMSIDGDLFIIYDYSDDFEQFADSTIERDEIAAACRDLFREAHLVITINDRLTIRAKQYNESSVTIPNATNYFMFRGNETRGRLKRKYQGPIIGYIGWLNGDRLDLEIIRHLAEKRPDWNLVFIGPQSHRHPLGNPREHPRNIHILKPVPFDCIPAMLSEFDVCILPNQINKHTEGNNPIKIFDYLASGKPIVSTRTAGTERFENYLYLADTKEKFLNSVEQSLSADTNDASQERVRIAYENSWDARFKTVGEILKHRLSL